MGIRLDGEWTGEYRYDQLAGFGLSHGVVSFRMSLQVSTANEISGEVQDDVDAGTPVPGAIVGRIRGDSFQFTKRFERLYVVNIEGGPAITFEECRRRDGKGEIDTPVSSCPIEYSGTWDPFGTKIFGSWFIRARIIRFAVKGTAQEVLMPKTTGTWTATRVTA